MPFDKKQVNDSFKFDPATLDTLRKEWLSLLDLTVFGDVKSSKIGAADRLRRRLLEMGEGLRSLTNDRSWIPHPRDQIKGAMGACVKLRDTLLGLERAARFIDNGKDFPHFEHELLNFRQRLLQLLETHEAQWAHLLDEQYEETSEQDNDHE